VSPAFPIGKTLIQRKRHFDPALAGQ